MQVIGSKISKLFDNSNEKKELQILLVGLGATGKTTILSKLGPVSFTIPTPGFEIETAEYKNLKFISWDFGSSGKIRPLWRYYYPDTKGIILVIDSSEKSTIEYSKDDLHMILNDEELKDAPLLIFANKKDHRVVSQAEVIELLNLECLEGRKWHIQETCGIKGEGIHEGVDWLTKVALKK